MAANIGDLAVRIGADTAGFESGMTSAARSVKSFSSSAVKKLRSVTNNAVKMGAAATAAGVAITAALYSKQSKVIDSLAKTADALNVTTESLQAMNHLAELNGVSSESMAKGLRRMEVNLGMAARTGGAAADALTDLGINIQDVLELDPSQQLQTLAGAISNVEKQSIKASIATDLFGRDGIAMLKVLNQVQKDGIEPTVKMLKDYGIAISRVDAAQVEAANDAFMEAKKIIEGAANTLTVELSPYVKELSERFKLAAKESGGFGDEVESAIQASIRGVGKLADVIHGLKVVFKGVQVIAAGFGAAMASAAELISTVFAEVFEFIAGNINTVIKQMNRLGTGIKLIDTITGSPFMKGVHALGDAARNNVAVLSSELHDMATEERPSDKIEKFLKSVRKESIETAGVVSDSIDKIINPTVDNAETDEERYARQEQLLRTHLSTMYGIQSTHSQGMLGLVNAQYGDMGSSTAAALGSMISTLGNSNKKAFELSKKFAIADALISTYQGIAAGVRLGYPMAIPAVAWAAATGFAQISKIKSQSFSGGGGGGGAASSAAPAASASTSSAQSSGGGESSGTLTVAPIDPGAIFSGSAMQSSMERIYDYSKDGGKVVFSA